MHISSSIPRRVWLLLSIGVALAASAAVLFGWAQVTAQRMLTLTPVMQEVQPGDPVTIPVLARDGLTDAPLAGVELVAWARPDVAGEHLHFVNYGDPGPQSAAVLGRGKTDGNGRAWLKVTAPHRGTGRIIVDARRGLDTDRLTAATWQRLGRGALLTTDRPSYHPGDVVRIRVRLIDERYRPVTDETHSLRIHGPERQALPIERADWFPDNQRPARFTVNLSTSRFGVGQTELRLPPDTAPGIYTVYSWPGSYARFRVGGEEPAALPVWRETLPSLREPAFESHPDWLVPKLENRLLFRVTGGFDHPIHARVGFPELGVPDAETDANGLLAVMLHPPEGVKVWAFDVRVTDDEGKSVVKQAKHRINAPDVVLVRTDRSAYRVGEELRINLVSMTSGPVLVNLHRSERIVESTSVELESGRGELRLRVSEDMLGLLDIDTHRSHLSGGDERGTNGEPLERYWILAKNQHKIYVVPGVELSVRLGTDRKLYRPGEVAKVRASVTQPRGIAPSAALSLVGVTAPELSRLQIPPGDDVALLADGKILCPSERRAAPPTTLLPDAGNALARDYLLARLRRSGALGPGERRWERRHFKLGALQQIAASAAIVCGICVGLLLAALFLGMACKRDGWRPGLPAFVIAAVVTAATLAARVPIRLALAREEPHPAERPGCMVGLPDNPGVADRCPEVEAIATSAKPLVWIPELLTDAEGLATVDIPIPDVKGTHVLVATAFTLDGRMATTRTSFEIE